MRILSAITAMAFALLAFQATEAAEIKVLTSGAFKPVVSEFVAAFERQTGDTVVVANDTAGALTRRIEAGEAFDVVVLTPAALDEFARNGKVAPGSVRALARVAIGVAVKTGALAPRIGTVEDFKRTLLDAPSVAYIDPAAGGSSGIYLDRLFARMGIADAIKPKAVLVPGGLVAQRVVSGEAAIAIHQISEILAVKGATLVGPIPAEIQNYTEYAGGLAGGVSTSEGAKTFLALLSGEGAKQVLKDKGMEPPAK